MGVFLHIYIYIYMDSHHPSIPSLLRYQSRPPRPAVVDPIALLELKALQMKRSLLGEFFIFSEIGKVPLEDTP